MLDRAIVVLVSTVVGLSPRTVSSILAVVVGAPVTRTTVAISDLIIETALMVDDVSIAAVVRIVLELGLTCIRVGAVVVIAPKTAPVLVVAARDPWAAEIPDVLVDVTIMFVVDIAAVACLEPVVGSRVCAEGGWLVVVVRDVGVADEVEVKDAIDVVTEGLLVVIPCVTRELAVVMIETGVVVRVAVTLEAVVLDRVVVLLDAMIVERVLLVAVVVRVAVMLDAVVVERVVVVLENVTLVVVG